jgi:addiction module HigA family antidote
MAFNLC